MPGRHDTHAVLLLAPDEGLYFPTPHALHAEVDELPVCSLNRPAAHAVQPPPQALASSQNPPDGHTPHAVCPVAPWNLPAVHASQGVARAVWLLTVPTRHMMQLAGAAVLGNSLYVPRSQGVGATERSGQ